MNFPHISGLGGVLIGSFITGLFSIIGVWQTGKHNEKIRKQDHEKIIIALINSIHDEIKNTYDRYAEAMGKYLESLKETELVMSDFYVQDDVFIIYKTNAANIGHIQNDHLRSMIIKTYILANSLILSLKAHNKYLEEYKNAYKDLQNSNNEFTNNNFKRNEKILRQSSSSIIEIHYQVKASVAKLVQELQKNKNSDKKKVTKAKRNP